MIKYNFNGALKALEKMASTAVYAFCYMDNDGSEDVYIYNEYAVLRVNAGIYTAFIAGKKPYAPPLAYLCSLAESNDGIVYNLKDKDITEKNISSHTLQTICNLFDTSVAGPGIDTNLSHCNYDNPGEINTRYIVGTDHLVTVNDDLHAAIISMYNNIGVYPEIYTRGDIKPVVYSAAGITIAVLPVRHLYEPINDYIMRLYRPEILQAVTVA